MSPAPLLFRPAEAEDAPALARLHTSVAENLTRLHGRGPWSTRTGEKGVLLAMRTSRVFVAVQDSGILATLRLATKKPWAINTSYFTPCRTPLYLLAMAVAPALQGRGIGRQVFDEGVRAARGLNADAVRLDAYDGAAGAGSFYLGCGCTERGRVTYRGAALVYYRVAARVVTRGGSPDLVHRPEGQVPAGFFPEIRLRHRGIAPTEVARVYIPPGFGTVTPYFFVRDAGGFVEFLVRALGGAEVHRSLRPDGGIANAQVRLGTSTVMASEASEHYPPMPAAFYLYVEDADSAVARALAGGAVLEMKVADMPYGDRQGGVRDPWGNLWWISQRIVDAPYGG